MQRICVFCGSSVGTRPEYAAAAEAMGRALVERGFELVYGGGRVGLMGLLADAVLAAGGRVTGVIPEALMTKELAHPGLQDLRVVSSMHTRKALMAELSDGFAALPGGFGTFEELCEIITWTQLGFQDKPCGLVNTAGFYDQLLAQFDRAVSDGFIRPDCRTVVIEAATPSELLNRFASHRPQGIRRWLDLETT